MPGLLVFISNIFRLLLWPLTGALRAIRRHPARYVFLRLPARITEFAPPKRSLLRLWASRTGHHSTSAEKIRQLLLQLREDPQMEGVVIELQPTSASWSVLGGIRRAVLELRSAGKQVVFYLPQGARDRELYLATSGDALFASPAASFLMLGIAVQQLYLEGLLRRLGLGVQVVAQGDFKTAAEGFTCNEMSPAQREQLRGVLDCRHRLLTEAVSRRLPMGATSEPLFVEACVSAERAMEVGLVRGAVYEDELPAALGQQSRGLRWAMGADSYRLYRKRTLWRPRGSHRYIAVVVLTGPIRGEHFPSFPGTEWIAATPTLQLLRAVRRDPHVAGVVLSIDSPGGSALASDLIHHEVERLAASKPVVAFFGGVAASGGYYIAAPAHCIVATPETITGSIGVITVRVVAERLFEQIGVHPQVVQTAPHADMMSVSRPWDADELALFDREGKCYYERFVNLVARGRHLAREAVLAAAGGRVWAAPDAQARGLVDVLGDFGTALDEVRSRVPMPGRAVLEPRRYRVRGSTTLQPAPADPSGWSVVTTAFPRELELWMLASGPERVLCYSPGAAFCAQ